VCPAEGFLARFQPSLHRQGQAQKRTEQRKHIGSSLSMGQYYRPIILSPDPEAENEEGLPLILGYFEPFNLAIKLKEHAYLRNNFMSYVVSQLMPGAPFHKCRVVWQGDYANPEPVVGGLLYEYCTRHEELHFKPEVPPPFSRHPSPPGANFLVNYSKSQYVDFSHITDTDIHPLPLLTWETPILEGAGEFRGEDPRGLCSSWARDVIGVESQLPPGRKWTEIIFDLQW
jgi:hypothetical protein